VRSNEWFHCHCYAGTVAAHFHCEKYIIYMTNLINLVGGPDSHGANVLPAYGNLQAVGLQGLQVLPPGDDGHIATGTLQHISQVTTDSSRTHDARREIWWSLKLLFRLCVTLRGPGKGKFVSDLFLVGLSSSRK